MNFRPKKPFLLSACLGLSLLPSPGDAASVYINTPARMGTNMTPVAGIKLRASTTNWDQSLDAGGGTNAGNFIQKELTNSFNGIGNDYHFTFEHRAGEGFIFKVTPTGQADSTLAWGNFTGGVPSGATVVSTINGRTPLTPFNALNIEARSQRPGSSLKFSQLLFTSPGMSVVEGSFFGATVTQNTVIGTSPAGTAFQSLVADTSLSLYNWTLSGDISIKRTPGSGGDESVKFTVDALQTTFLTPVPEPGSALLSLTGLALLTCRKRRSTDAV